MYFMKLILYLQIIMGYSRFIKAVAVKDLSLKIGLIINFVDRELFLIYY